MSHFIVYLCSFERGSSGLGYFQFDFIFTETCPQSSPLRQVKGDFYTSFGEIEEFWGRRRKLRPFLPNLPNIRAELTNFLYSDENVMRRLISLRTKVSLDKAL